MNLHFYRNPLSASVKTVILIINAEEWYCWGQSRTRRSQRDRRTEVEWGECTGTLHGAHPARASSPEITLIIFDNGLLTWRQMSAGREGAQVQRMCRSEINHGFDPGLSRLWNFHSSVLKPRSSCFWTVECVVFFEFLLHCFRFLLMFFLLMEPSADARGARLYLPKSLLKLAAEYGSRSAAELLEIWSIFIQIRIKST